MVSRLKARTGASFMTFRFIEAVKKGAVHLGERVSREKKELRRIPLGDAIDFLPDPQYLVHALSKAAFTFLKSVHHARTFKAR